MTYKVIQDVHKRLYNKTIKSCWIADVKRQLGISVRKAYNRRTEEIGNKCPERFVLNIIRIIQ